jgi:hypothetical protein
MTRFVLGGTTVQFNADPIRPSGEKAQLHQQTGRDGSGALYIYTKSNIDRRRHCLQFTHISAAVRTDLLSFLRNNALGVKETFTWIDQDEVARSVRIEKPTLNLDPIGPDRYAGVIVLIEDL